MRRLPSHASSVSLRVTLHPLAGFADRIYTWKRRRGWRQRRVRNSGAWFFYVCALTISRMDIPLHPAHLFTMTTLLVCLFHSFTFRMFIYSMRDINALFMYIRSYIPKLKFIDSRAIKKRVALRRIREKLLVDCFYGRILRAPYIYIYIYIYIYVICTWTVYSILCIFLYFSPYFLPRLFFFSFLPFQFSLHSRYRNDRCSQFWWKKKIRFFVNTTSLDCFPFSIPYFPKGSYTTSSIFIISRRNDSTLGDSFE